ncbi:MAG: urease accessory protein UreD [Nitrospiria bacterium]
MKIKEESWKAVLEIDLEKKGGKTIVGRMRHQGPLLVQKGFYPEGPETCHLYILHPPGGVVAGDYLGLTLSAEPGARGLLTTPSAGKFYRSGGQHLWGHSQQAFHVGRGASLEWFPQETILFDGTQSRIETRVDLEEEGSFLGWEILCLGRTASGEWFKEGTCSQRFEIYRSGEPVWIERNRIEGGSPFLEERWGMGGFTVTGTFACVLPRPDSFPDLFPEAYRFREDEFFCVSRPGGILLARYLGSQAESAKAFFLQVWGKVRPYMMNREICIPRIWHT